MFYVARPARSIQYFSFSLFVRGKKGETELSVERWALSVER